MIISNNRSLSRLAAVQTLFQYDFNEKMKLQELKSINDLEISEIYETIKNLNNGISEFKGLNLDKDWFLILVNSVFNNRNKIDNILSDFLSDDWSIERMDQTIINILRCAYIEFKDFSKIPPKVIISEYTNIAASFFDRTEVNFINGVLDKVSSSLRT
jgi:N utilization substance protein B